MRNHLLSQRLGDGQKEEDPGQGHPPHRSPPVRGLVRPEDVRVRGFVSLSRQLPPDQQGDPKAAQAVDRQRMQYGPQERLLGLGQGGGGQAQQGACHQARPSNRDGPGPRSSLPSLNKDLR